MLSNHLSLGLPRGLFPYVFPTNSLYAFLFSSIRATCPAHLLLLDLIILIILDKDYKSRSSLLCRSPPSRHFIPLRLKYCPQHPLLKRPQWIVQFMLLNKDLSVLCSNVLVSLPSDSSCLWVGGPRWSRGAPRVL
jgi:hypothetical protein